MKRWTREEIELLKNNYGIKSRDYLCNILFNRTWRSIQEKAHQLSLCHLTPEERFWKYVDKKNINDCWNWIGACDKDGYGSIGVNGRLIGTHRFSWALKNGKIPDGIWVCHICDNPKCVNPKHLWLGTRQDDMDDKVKKDRQSKLYGENNGRTKLTLNQVKQIKNLKGKLYERKIAKIFDVSNTTIGRIHRNKTWRNHEGEK